MNADILFLGPETGRIKQALKNQPGRPLTWAYLGQDVAKFHQVRQAFRDVGTWLDTGDRFNQAAASLREPYLAYLYGIGAELKSIRWWLSSLSYRNPHTSKTFHQACYLQVALDLVQGWEGSGPLVVVLADEPVRRALRQNLQKTGGAPVLNVPVARANPFRGILDLARTLVYRAYFVIREGRRVFTARRTIPQPLVPKGPTTVLISSVSSRNISKGPEFHSSFFGELGGKLQEYGCQLTVVPLVLRDVAYRDVLPSLLKDNHSIAFPHRYLRLSDLFRVALETWTMPPLPRSIPKLEGMDISPMVNEDMREHRISNWSADALLLVALVRRWRALGWQIDRIIYVYENQPWERALCWQVRRSFPEAALVGYQHSTIPRLLLKFYLAEGGEREAPLPDRVVTVGQLTADQMRSDGHRPDQVLVGGALQMDGLYTADLNDGLSPVIGDVPSVLFAASVGLEDTADFWQTAVELFGEEEGIKVVLKFHPSMPRSKVESLVKQQMPPYVEITDDPIIDLFQRCSVLVYTESSVCFQALAFGLPAIHLRPQFDLDMDPLENAPEARLQASGLDELREKVLWLLEHRTEYVAAHREQWDRLVEQMYGPLTEGSYRAFID